MVFINPPPTVVCLYIISSAEVSNAEVLKRMSLGNGGGKVSNNLQLNHQTTTHHVQHSTLPPRSISTTTPPNILKNTTKDDPIVLEDDS